MARLMNVGVPYFQHHDAMLRIMLRIMVGCWDPCFWIPYVAYHEMVPFLGASSEKNVVIHYWLTRPKKGFDLLLYGQRICLDVV